MDALALFVVTGLVMKAVILILGLIFLVRNTIPKSAAFGMMVAPIIVFSLLYINMLMSM